MGAKKSSKDSRTTTGGPPKSATKHPDDARLSTLIEDALAEVSEKIFKRLHDEGYIANAIFMDKNIGEDLLTAIEEELRACIRG